VKVLQAQTKALKTRAACLGALGVSQYGSPTATPATGYLYTNDAGATIGLTTGLDVTQQGQTPGAWIAQVANPCITSSKSATS
jgi:hypothetical protein